MRRRFSVSQARGILPDLLDQVSLEGPVEITRRGERIAVLVSAEEFDRLNANRGDVVDFLEDFRRKHDLEALWGEEGPWKDVRDRTAGRTFPL